MIRYSPNFVIEPDLSRLKNGFTIMLNPKWTQDPILNRPETPDPKSVR